jgi:hypothetical protein
MFAIAESEKLASGAKAPLIPGGLSARLKSGPVTKPVWREFFRSLFSRALLQNLVGKGFSAACLALLISKQLAYGLKPVPFMD